MHGGDSQFAQQAHKLSGRSFDVADDFVFHLVLFLLFLFLFGFRGAS
jgi:hypothetical protein